MAEEWAELGEAIAAIRAGIERAVVEGAASSVKFEMGPVELELTAAVHKDARGTVKVMLLPWSAGSEAGLAVDRVQRIKVTLQPIEPGAGGGKPRRRQISDDDAR